MLNQRNVVRDEQETIVAKASIDPPPPVIKREGFEGGLSSDTMLHFMILLLILLVVQYMTLLSIERHLSMSSIARAMIASPPQI